MVVARRKRSEHFDLTLYGTCPECVSWMFLVEIKRHQKERCLAIKQKREHLPSTSQNLQTQSKLLKGDAIEIFQGASNMLKEKVLCPMRRGDVKTVVMSDRLIIRLGEEWLAKSSRNYLRCGNYTSDRMRRVARLLLECRNIQQNHQTMEDLINVGGVDVIIEASQRLSGSDGALT